MMRAGSKKGFTVAEIIVAIMILVFFSTVIAQLFTQAQKASLAAQELDGAVLCLSDLADQWKGAPEADAPEAVRLLWAGQPEARLFIDAAFQPCPQPQARYRVDLAQVFGPPDGFSRLDLILLDLQTDRVVTELTAGRYQPSAEGGGPS